MMQLQTVYALLQRDFMIMRRDFLDTLINMVFIVGVYELTFGYLGARAGIVSRASSDVFVGNFGILFLFLSFHRAFTDLFAIHLNGFFAYKQGLPLTFNWLLLTHVLSYILQYVINLVPLFFIGKVLLGAKLSFAGANWPLFLAVVVAAMVLCAAVYVLFACTVSIPFFTGNYWQRVHVPLFLLGCTFFSYKPVVQFSPLLGKLLLFNPYTYVNEGMRSALFGGDAYIAAPTCLMVISLCALSALIALFVFAKPSLDAV